MFLVIRPCCSHFESLSLWLKSVIFLKDLEIFVLNRITETWFCQQSSYVSHPSSNVYRSVVVIWPLKMWIWPRSYHSSFGDIPNSISSLPGNLSVSTVKSLWTLPHGYPCWLVTRVVGWVWLFQQYFSHQVDARVTVVKAKLQKENGKVWFISYSFATFLRPHAFSVLTVPSCNGNCPSAINCNHNLLGEHV